jgi:uncharacterized protein (TIGR02646 family)
MSIRDTDVYEEVVNRLLLDQRGICAYCEVDLIITDGVGYSDLRVEHFHPKSDNHPTWTYNWENLLLTCCGGNRNYIAGDKEGRFTSPDHSCDVPKENKVLDGKIFHPAQEKGLKSLLFKYHSDGRMEVSETCPESKRDQARNTISELSLSPEVAKKGSKIETPRLVRMRSAFLSGLSEQVQNLLEQGNDIDKAMEELAEILFPADEAQNWTKFFSCARWYLGPAAENRLADLEYV